MMFGFEPTVSLGIAVLAAYMLGALSGGLLIGALLGKEDLRSQGSGNAGATNALRTGGRGYGALVLLFDLLKGVLAATVLPWLAGGGYTLALVCGAVAVVGHIWPVYYGFRGGKGAATLIGVLLVVLPVALLAGLGVWIAVLVTTGYVALATLLGMTAIVLAVPVVQGWVVAPLLFAGVMWALLVYTHRENIARLRAGNENRFEKAMLLHRGTRR